MTNFLPDSIKNIMQNQNSQKRTILAVATRSDGFFFMLVMTSQGVMVKAGCQFRTIGSYRRHIRHAYRLMGRYEQRKMRETRPILDLFEQGLKRPLP